eukprot:scaffold236_cov419-Prasinococcus_capsulatus_cf.AAC.17
MASSMAVMKEYVAAPVTEVFERSRVSVDSWSSPQPLIWIALPPALVFKAGFGVSSRQTTSPSSPEQIAVRDEHY